MKKKGMLSDKKKRAKFSGKSRTIPGTGNVTGIFPRIDRAFSFRRIGQLWSVAFPLIQRKLNFLAKYKTVISRKRHANAAALLQQPPPSVLEPTFFLFPSPVFSLPLPSLPLFPPNPAPPPGKIANHQSCRYYTHLINETETFSPVSLRWESQKCLGN